MNDKEIKAYTSSKSTEWITPQRFYDFLDNEFHFTLDPCSTEQNHKAKKYFTIEQDGLIQSWMDEIVFMNPPYGRYISDWVKKVDEEIYLTKLADDSRIDRESHRTVIVALLPARTDGRWFQTYVARANKLRFIKGRIKFVNGLTGEVDKSPLFPSVVAIWDSFMNNEYSEIQYMDSKTGRVWLTSCHHGRTEYID